MYQHRYLSKNIENKVLVLKEQGLCLQPPCYLKAFDKWGEVQPAQWSLASDACRALWCVHCVVTQARRGPKNTACGFNLLLWLYRCTKPDPVRSLKLSKAGPGLYLYGKPRKGRAESHANGVWENVAGGQKVHWCRICSHTFVGLLQGGLSCCSCYHQSVCSEWFPFPWLCKAFGHHVKVLYKYHFLSLFFCLHNIK